MNIEHKSRLAEQVKAWLGQGADYSQGDLARKTGMSQTNISHVASGKWKDVTISEAQWVKLLMFFRVDGHIESQNFVQITAACQVAQMESRCVAVDGYTGAGKSYSLEAFARTNARVFIIRARRSMGTRMFVSELGKALGVSRPSGATYDVENQICDRLSRLERPLVIIDEVEYLKPAALDSLKTIMQELAGRCGFVVSGIIKQWIEKMATRNVPGMPQFLRRIGHSWVECQEISLRDVRSAADSMGITDEQVVKCLFRDCKDYDRLQTYVKDLVAASEGAPVSMHTYKSLF